MEKNCKKNKKIQFSTVKLERFSSFYRLKYKENRAKLCIAASEKHQKQPGEKN